MRTVASLCFVVMIGFSGARAAEPPATLAEVAWLTGAWLNKTGDAEVEEQWMAPKGGLMLGLNRTTEPKKPSAFEFLRIEEREKSLVFIAQPGGKSGTEFPLVELKAKQAKFVRKGKGFPTTITYSIDAKERLIGKIEGDIDSKPASMEWTWDKVK